MKKIAVIGCAGSGKTTLAQRLQTLLGLPLHHLDQYYWQPHWQQPIFENFAQLHDQLCDTDSWIIDGMYARTLYYRCVKADTIIFLDMPRYRCLWRVIKRLLKNYKKTTASSAPECVESIDFQFLQWVWNFKKRSHQHILDIIELFGTNKTIYIFKTNKQVVDFIESLKNYKS